MFYKIIDEKTKKVDVGFGTNTEFYKSIGMVEGEVEQGYDGWYIKGYAPKKTQELIDKEKIEESKRYLADTDYVVIKIVEAMISGDLQLINELKSKYSDVLKERVKTRKQINKLKKK